MIIVEFHTKLIKKIKNNRMKAIKIKENVYWVGAIDWNIRNFHGYLTQKGTTYNAYLIIDEKITLIDTVKPCFKAEMFERISSVIDPSKIDYVISNHVEMDHSGAIPSVLDVAMNAELITCVKGADGLKKHFPIKNKIREVQTGESISIGKRTFQFILTPMVHWPDNMLTYCKEDKILFSNDSLGQHYASSERFDYECPFDIVMHEAKKYYANIVMPYSKQVKNELKSLDGLDIEIVAPSHGIIWTKYIKEIFSNYVAWSNGDNKKKAVVIYCSMWKSTEAMASQIYSVFEDADYSVKYINLQNEHESDIITEVLDSEYVCIGSPTLNKGLMPVAAGFLEYLKGLFAGEKKGIVFGSYGWTPQATTEIEQAFAVAKIEVVALIKQQYVPTTEDLKNVKEVVSSLLR